MSDPCPYKCANPDCSYRRSLDEREAHAELARLRDENERLRQQVRERPDQEAIDMALSRAVLAERELAALRRPMVDSTGIDMVAEHDRIRRDHEEWYHTKQMYDVPQHEWLEHQVSVHRLLEYISKVKIEHADDRKELIRTQAMVTTADAACIRRLQSSISDLKAELAGLKSPPEERKDIVERHAARLDFLRTHDYPLSSDPPGADIDALLQDCTRLRNAHQDRVAMLAFVQGELNKRNAECVELRERCERLEMWPRLYAGLMTDYEVQKQRIERLEGALRLVLPMAKGWAAANPVGANQQICNAAEAALAAQPAADGRQSVGPNGECPICEGCGREIDTQYCWCGSSMDHSQWDGHTPVNMGCVCGFEMTDAIDAHQEPKP